MFIQYINIGKDQTKIVGVCNTNAYILNKGILKYRQKGNKQSIKKYLNYTTEKSLSP